MAGELVLGYIRRDMVYGEFMDSMINFIYHDLSRGRRLHCGVQCADGIFCDNNRNALVRKFLDNTPAQWLLMIDTDMIFTAQEVYYLYDAAQQVNHAGIFSGLAFTYMPRVEGDLVYRRLVPAWVPLGHAQMGGDGTFVPKLGAIQEIEACGAACLLVHRSVYQEMELRWHDPDDPWVWFGRDVIPRVSEDQPPQRYGEDFSFSARVRAYGMKVFGVGTVFKHLKVRVEDYETYLYENGMDDEPPAPVGAEGGE